MGRECGLLLYCFSFFYGALLAGTSIYGLIVKDLRLDTACACPIQQCYLSSADGHRASNGKIFGLRLLV